MNEIKIRVGNEKDVETIATISRETFYSAYAVFNTQANMEKFMQDFFSAATIRKELNEKKIIYLIAENNAGIAGYAKLKDSASPAVSLHNNNVMEIARIYASVNKINTGVGSIIMNECIAIAKQLTRNFIWLGVWENNLKAIRFYKRFGFKEFGTHIFMLGDDEQTDLLMAKQIDIR